MKKQTKILLACLVVLSGAIGGFFYIRQSSRVLAFENHNPLRKGLSDSDFNKLFKIHQDCFLEAKRKNLRLYFMKYHGMDSTTASKKTETILSKISDDQEEDFGSFENAFIMRDRGEIVGLFTCREENEATHGSMMVFNVCVRKDKQGQGYGRELMLHANEKCPRPGKDFTLTVYKDDTKVVNFYKGLGWEIMSDLSEWDHQFNFFNKYLMKYKPAESREDRQD